MECFECHNWDRAAPLVTLQAACVRSNCKGFFWQVVIFLCWSIIYRMRPKVLDSFRCKFCRISILAETVFMKRLSPQEGVKTENDHINLKVAGQDGSVVQFKIKRHTPLSKLMKAYCERQVSLGLRLTLLSVYKTFTHSPHFNCHASLRAFR